MITQSCVKTGLWERKRMDAGEPHGAGRGVGVRLLTAWTSLVAV